MYCNSLYIILLFNLYWLNINGEEQEEQTTEYPDENFEEDDVPFTLQNRILNGQRVTSHKYPFIVSLQQQFSNGRKAKFCGGVILNKRWILTAAHCFDGENDTPDKSDFRVNAGVLDAFSYGTSTSQFVPVERIELHPSYNKETFENDIAMLKLAQPLQFNDYVKPIPLPPRGYRAKGVGKILGWGAIDHDEKVYSRYLKVANIGVSRIKDCREYFDDLSADRQICLGINGKTNACSGDSGGPFLKVIRGKVTVVGVTSFGKEGCNEGIPIIYTNVASYLSFIEKTMRKYKNDWVVWN